MSFRKPIVSYDEQYFLDRIAVKHGDEAARAVEQAMLPLDERIAALEKRQREIHARLDELVTEYPQLKSARSRPGSCATQAERASVPLAPRKTTKGE